MVAGRWLYLYRAIEQFGQVIDVLISQKRDLSINKIRYVIEQVIANFKTWRIMHTDYRRPLDTFTQTISTVIALHFYKLARE
jgi:transposase-like protein